MKRWLAGAVIAGGAISNSGCAGMPSEMPGQDKDSALKHPNILFIMTDQHNAAYLNCLGHKELKTPNFDSLAKHSVIFNSAYSASPICGPSRACIFTGQYPLQNGVYTNWIPIKDESMLLSKRLGMAGYYNVMIGKLHLSPVDSSHGFQYKRLCESPYDVYDKKEVQYNDYLTWVEKDKGISREKVSEMAGESERAGVNDPRFWLGWSWMDNDHSMTTWTGNEAVSFLKSWNEEKPFFMHVSFFGPHHPYSTGEPWNSMYNPDEVSLPPTLGVLQPGAQKGFRAEWPDSLWRQMISKYSGNISAIDFQIGRIINELKAKGLWENTLIVFTSDHGDHMGDFSQLGKGTMLESSVRVPFFIKPPGAEPVRHECGDIVNLIDLYSTFLDYAGISDSSHHDSHSIRKLLSGNSEWQNSTFSSLCSPDGKTGQIMYIMDKYKCVGFLNDGKLKVELYDRTSEVPDLRNLASEPEYSEIVLKMKITMEEWMKSFKKN